MFTPYDWQEGIGHRAQYIEAKLMQGMPVVAISVPDGILIATYRRQVPKIYEIYDRLAFAAVGQQSDIESLRSAALEYASKEGYNRSESDVTVQRVVTALSAPLKRAFGDFNTSPVVARSFFAEVGQTVEDDLYYVLDYDGDYSITRSRVAISGSIESGQTLEDELSKLEASDLGSLTAQLKTLIFNSTQGDKAESDDPVPDTFTFEAVLLERAELHDNRFRRLSE